MCLRAVYIDIDLADGPDLTLLATLELMTQRHSQAGEMNRVSHHND
jgi:hypothetical protein